MPMRTKSYFFRQLLTLVAAVALPLLAMEGYNLHRNAARARLAAFHLVENYAAAIAHDTDSWIADTRQFLLFLAERPLIRSLDAGRCDPLLEGVTRRRRLTANVFIVDLHGRPVCFSAVGPGTLPSSLQSYEWFREAERSDSMTVSKPFLAPVVRRMVSAVSVPLRDAAGQRIGTVTLLLDLEGLQSEWAHYVLPADSRISVLSASGTILATAPDFAALVGKDASGVIQRARALNAGDVGVAPGIDGIERAFALRPIPSAGWQAAVAIPTTVVFGPYQAQLRQTLGLMAVTMIATLALALLLAHRMARPFATLVAAARSIRAGERDCRAPANLPGEFRELAGEFNAMLDAGQRHIDFYDALSQTNGAIVRMRSEQALFDEICRICVEHGHASIAYVSMIDGQRMVHIASAGPAHDFIVALQTRGADIVVEGSGLPGLSGVAASSGVCQISNDAETDERTVPWRAAGRVIGTKSIASCPFRRGGKTAGTLTLHMNEAGFFGARQMALLEEMTGDISFALDNFAREQTIAVHDRQLSGLVDTAMDAIICVDAKHDIRLFNRAAAEMFGVDARAAIGTSIQRFVPLRLRTAHESHMASFAVTGVSTRQHGLQSLQALRADGSEFPIEASISRFGDGDAVLMTVVIRDATAALAAEQGKIALVVAETRSRAKTEFLSRMSHELRTPLNAVLGFSQLLQTDTREPLSVDQHNHVEHIRLAGWHLLALINDVLEIAKIEGGHVMMDERRVDLVRSLDEAVLLNRTDAERARVNIDCDYQDPVSGYVFADPRRLRQVMINVLSNAIKYNHPAGTVRLRVASAGPETSIEVVDTGIGMDPSQIERLYEPFNRLGRERLATEGTGLGLALSRQLVQLMGGRIDIDSEAGVGTRVLITLRAHPDQSSPELASLSDPQDGLTATAIAPFGTVLYIEDNAVNFMLVEALLLRWPKVVVLHAADGREGLAMASTRSPDLILLDMHLPDMTGIEVLRSLAGMPDAVGVPVIALSASAMVADVEAAMGAGALQYWTKPFKFDQFVEGTRAALLAAGQARRERDLDAGSKDVLATQAVT